MLVSLESLQNGYELHERVLIRMGWDMATAHAEAKFKASNKQSDAITLWKELIDVDPSYANIVAFFLKNAKRIDAVIA
jgi:hypothetical protein